VVIMLECAPYGTYVTTFIDDLQDQTFLKVF
jgi:hypothetical protein